MSLFDWFRKKAPERPPAPAPKPRSVHRGPAKPAELELLESIGPDADWELALSALFALQNTSHERDALAAIARAASAQPLAEALAVAAAELRVKRGEMDRALELLSRPRSVPALLLAADLQSERGELAVALTLVERALAQNIDAPGARERHARFQRALGGGRAPEASQSRDATLLTASAPETSFRLVGEAGRGGAGTVYEAVDDALSRRVALKVYHEPERDREKLIREARTAVAFRGRGVVRVFDIDTDRGLVVMEWLPAGALKRWLLRSDGEFLWPLQRWLLPLSQALARVHDAGWVHGDLKPANVLFRSADAPVLSDFGLSHPIGERVEAGSRGYLSPERLAGRPLSPADDVYALGRLMEDALVALGKTEASPSRAASGLERLCARCLGPLEDRPATARQLEAALRQG